jgi:hypothetical protein
MALPTNSLQNVQTYQMSNLAYLQNLNAFVATSNSRFKNFQDFTGQLGATVGFTLPTRFTTTNSLVASFQGTEQRVLTLTLDQQLSTSYAFNSQQLLLNVEEYMNDFGKAATLELGANVESNIAEVCVTAPYRFYGDGVTPINSYNQLAQGLAQVREFGAAVHNYKFYLSNLSVASIIANGLNQFAPSRNDRDAMSWEVGRFDNCDFYRSNLLPVHTAGSEGQAASTLTVVSTTTNSEGGVTSITFSGCSAASDADSVKENDKFQFSDGVSGYTNLRFRTFVGHKVSGLPVQFRATADAASTAGSQVTVTIDPPLQAASGKNQNINTTIVAGMQAKALPSHRAGLITCGDPLFLAMPRLPDQPPYLTGNAIDEDTGVSIRQTYGTLFGQNEQGFVHDVLFGKRLAADYAVSVIFPL